MYRLLICLITIETVCYFSVFSNVVIFRLIYICINIIRKICLKRLDTGRDGDNRDGDNLEKQGKITNKDEIKKNKSLDTPLFDPR